MRSPGQVMGLLLLVACCHDRASAGASSTSTTLALPRSSLASLGGTTRAGFKQNNQKNVPAPPPAAKPAPAKSLAPAPASGGVRTIFGGLLMHLALGTLYCWGNFISYCPTSLRFFDGVSKSSPPDAQLVIPLTIAFMTVSLPLSPIIQRQIGEQATALLGSWIMAAGVFLASYAKSLAAFMVFYCMFFGLGVGLAYTAPIVAGWKWFPNNKGLVSGSVLTGFGAGGFFFNLIGTRLINPNKVNPVNGNFPPEIYDRFPMMLRSLAGLYLALTLVGSLMLSTPSTPVAVVTKSKVAGGKASDVKVPDYEVSEALKSGKFWLIWMIVVSMTAGSLATSSIYKGFGSRVAHLNYDTYQSLVGGLGALANGFGRIFWGSMSDKHGFKKAMLVLATLQATTMSLYNALTASQITFALGTMSIFFTLGGCFAMFPPLMSQVFGPRNGVSVYTYLYSGFAVASVGSTFLAKALVQSVGWDKVFQVFALSTAVGLGLTSIFNP